MLELVKSMVYARTHTYIYCMTRSYATGVDHSHADDDACAAARCRMLAGPVPARVPPLECREHRRGV
jgi:hypothetical protein